MRVQRQTHTAIVLRQSKSFADAGVVFMTQSTDGTNELQLMGTLRRWLLFSPGDEAC